MAVTITRDYPTEDDGTGTTGDAIDNDWLEGLFDDIDTALAQLTPTSGVDSTSATGITFGVRNTTSGTGAFSQLRTGNNSAANVTSLYAFSSAYTTAGGYLQGGSALVGHRAAGLSIIAEDAAGTIGFYTGGSASGNLRGTITAAGVLSWAGGVTLSGLTASQAVFTDGSKGLVSNAITGSGNVVMSASPTLTGTITAAVANFSGAVSALRISTDGTGSGSDGRIRLTSATPVWTPNQTTSTGTAIISDGDVWYKQSSSARYKERITAARIRKPVLEKFVALDPCWWDYTGKKTGALGFIAEHLHALPLRRYGRSPLVNYDKKGHPESNREFGLIALQHLVIRDLWRRVSHLEQRSVFA